MTQNMLFTFNPHRKWKINQKYRKTNLNNINSMYTHKHNANKRVLYIYIQCPLA